MQRIAGTPFAADYWGPLPGLKLYFLSHMHTDHTSGLHDEWRGGPIYCSPITKELLHSKWPGIPRDLVVPLSVGDTHLVYLDDERIESMNVTLIDANHCPGAVMFLWEGSFGVVLYTGDFRYVPQMVDGSRISQVAVDTLYLDNTYLDSTFEFPSQYEALHQVVERITSLENFRAYTVLVGIDMLGKERLLIDLALHFETRVEVTSERYESLRTIYLSGGFTKQAFEVFFDEERPVPRTRIAGPLFVLTRRQGIGIALGERRRKLREQFPGEEPRLLGVIPTGWVKALGDRKTEHKDRVPVVRVPYSIHSSYEEIVALVAHVRPLRVIPIVSGSPCPPDVIRPLLRDMSAVDGSRLVGTVPANFAAVSQKAASSEFNLALPVKREPVPGQERDQKPMVRVTHTSVKGLKFGVSKERAAKIQESAEAQRRILAAKPPNNDAMNAAAAAAAAHANSVAAARVARRNAIDVEEEHRMLKMFDRAAESAKKKQRSEGESICKIEQHELE